MPRAFKAMILASMGLAGSFQEQGQELNRAQAVDAASLWIDKPVGDPILVKLSDALTIVMRVEGSASLVVDLAEEPAAVPGWQLQPLTKPALKPLDESKKKLWEQRFLATPLQPGTYPIKLPGLVYSDGGEEKRVDWQPLPLRITTRVDKADVSEARDRTSVEDLPPPPPTEDSHWWPWLLLILPLIGASALFLLRRRPLPLVVRPAPRKAAMEELDALGQRSLDTQAQSDEFLISLSNTLRRYLEQRFGLPATSQTTQEFFAALGEKPAMDEARKRELNEILQICDLAKFAAVGTTPEQCRQMLELTREFIEKGEGQSDAKAM